MEKIYFDDTTYIWKTKLNRTADKSELLKESNIFIESHPEVITDGYGYKMEWNDNLDFLGEIKIESKLDEIVQIGINSCKELYEQKNVTYNKINTDSWINVVRSKNPIQVNFNNNEKYHVHTDINKKIKSFFPHYTYVYYIQMPDIMTGDDGVLFFKSENEKEYWIRPEEDDLIIMEGWMPHAPNNAPNSTLDRVVMAGNVGFEFIKKENSLI